MKVAVEKEVCFTPGRICLNVTYHSHITLTMVGLFVYIQTYHAIEGHFMFVKAMHTLLVPN